MGNGPTMRNFIVSTVHPQVSQAMEFIYLLCKVNYCSRQEVEISKSKDGHLKINSGRGSTPFLLSRDLCPRSRVIQRRRHVGKRVQ